MSLIQKSEACILFRYRGLHHVLCDGVPSRVLMASVMLHAKVGSVARIMTGTQSIKAQGKVRSTVNGAHHVKPDKKSKKMKIKMNRDAGN